RHLRQARRRYRARRDALVAAVRRHLPGARVTGLAAGLHAIVRLPREFDGASLMRAAAERSLGVYPLALGYMRPRPRAGAFALAGGWDGVSWRLEPAADPSGAQLTTLRAVNCPARCVAVGSYYNGSITQTLVERSH